jgi:glycosyltransferase involved in cell wall biosynthesis
LFDQTCALLLNRPAGRGLGGIPLTGRNLSVLALPEPHATGVLRKVILLPWLAGHWPRLWKQISSADVVHALVPGDLGVIGALLARLLGRRLVVRHCGTWGHRGTLADRFLAWWLPRLARSGKAIVFATGAGDAPPAPGVPNLHWIFSTALSAGDLERITSASPWEPRTTPRLVCVGRLTRGKNFHAVIEALPVIRQTHPTAVLEILGDGPARTELMELARELGVEEAVNIRGNVDREEVLRTLSTSHVFVFPTRVAEGFPKAVVEALACGVPVLAASVSVIPRLLVEGGGRLLEATDEQSVARGVLALLEAPEHLPAMGSAGRQTASHYTLERWRDEIGRVLEAAWGPLRSP